MDTRNTVDGLKTLLGLSPAASSQPEPGRKATSPSAEPFQTDRTSLSSAGSSISQPMSEQDVRAEKVADIRVALTAGTYSIPASAVAAKVVDSMLSNRNRSEN